MEDVDSEVILHHEYFLLKRSEYAFISLFARVVCVTFHIRKKCLKDHWLGFTIAFFYFSNFHIDLDCENRKSVVTHFTP